MTGHGAKVRIAPLVLEYVGNNIDEDTIKVIEQHALEFLAINREVAPHG